MGSIGQRCYEAYLQALDPRAPWDAHPWSELPAATQRAWEAAAQTVIVHYDAAVQQRASFDMLRTQQRGPAHDDG